MLEVIDGRRLEATTPWFKERKHDLKFTEVVAVDMNAGYSNLAHSFMPNADICFDKFHVMQVLNNAVDSTRKEEQGTMTEDQRKQIINASRLYRLSREMTKTK